MTATTPVSTATDLTGQVALVTGGARGIGAATAKALAVRGHQGGVISLVRWPARYGGAEGVRANAVAPGFVVTEMSRDHLVPETYRPLGRLGEPEDIAHAVVCLASPASNYVTGQCLDVNGGAYMA